MCQYGFLAEKESLGDVIPMRHQSQVNEFSTALLDCHYFWDYLYLAFFFVLLRLCICPDEDSSNSSEMIDYILFLLVGQVFGLHYHNSRQSVAWDVLVETICYYFIGVLDL